ncbi:MAG: hypothetical protein BIFFINMI_01469 [Phycisphaerae bacterium]|nr:hypothetical protein [Phycisphaerae bacterium]
MSDILTERVIQLIVALAASLFAVRLLGKSRGNGLTRMIFCIGVGLVLVPALVQIARQYFGVHDGRLTSILSRMAAPGFGVVLLGVLRAMHLMRNRQSVLQEQNVTLKEQAATDPLTGLLNRREADSLLEYGAQRARDNDYYVGFIMVDLDHFKEINDKHGHQAGDAVLSHVAGLLKSRLRGGDIVSRYGGDEFLIVLVDPDADKIAQIANELRELIETRPADFEGRKFPIGASIGFSISRGHSNWTTQEAIAKADAALYSAKAEGRNRVAGSSPYLRIAQTA